MSRPDAEYLKRNAANVFSAAGETAILRSYVSASAGSPHFGIQQGQSFHERTITGLFAAGGMGAGGRGRERMMPPGFVQDVDLFVTTHSALAARDEIEYRGVTYVIFGDPQLMMIGGRLQWRSPLRRSNTTG